MPVVDEIVPIHDVLAALAPGEPISHGALTVVPLLASGGAEPDWLTLDEAADAVVIGEVGEAGAVPELTVTSMATRPVLLLDGEELVGAKQNRVLNTTVLVGARATVRIPVSCVEAGRWRYQGRHLSPSGVALYASVRARKAASVSRSLRTGKGHRSDQGEVWDELEARAQERRVGSPTCAMSDVYRQYREELEATRRALAPRPGQVGALVYLEGSWLGLDLLASPGLFARAWGRLSTGYAADALGTREGRAPRLGPETILGRVGRLAVEPAPAVGLGDEYRLSGPRVHGAALVAEGHVAHLAVFRLTGLA